MRTKPSLTLADVKKMLAACEAEAVKNKWNVSIAIVDDGAHLLGFQRMDGCGPISAEVAVGKAHTSALTWRPSKFFEDRVKDRPAFTTFPAGTLIQAHCRSCTRTSVSAPSACRACNRTRTSRSPKRDSTRSANDPAP